MVKEWELLYLKQGEMSVMECVAKFNELSEFAPNQMAIEQMRMNHFEQGLRGGSETDNSKIHLW